MPDSSEPRWTRWWQDDLPCLFTQSQAAANAKYLSEVLGARFIAGARHRVAEVKHPILQRWNTEGANAFIELNALAEDLRIVERAEGFSDVLDDLRDTDRALPTWHVIHVAALLSRPEGSRLEQFYTANDKTLPDFLVSIGGSKVAVEAKLLSNSDNQQAFADYADSLATAILRDVLPLEGLQPVPLIVLKAVEALPPVDEVVAAVVSLVGEGVEYRSSGFNMFLETPSRAETGNIASRGCYILCPRSDNENSRVESMVRKASKQLSSPPTTEYPGLLALGVTELQNPNRVASILKGRFAAGKYSGIAGVLMIQSYGHAGPPELAPIDVTGLLRNKHSAKTLPELRYLPLGYDVNFATPEEDQIPAYRYFIQEARVGASGGSVRVPDLRGLRPEMLA